MDEASNNQPGSEFFLDLAMQGKDAWNKWRSRTPQNKLEDGSYDNFVNFENFDFSKLENIPSFEEFHFGKAANFRFAKFGSHHPNFKSCKFGDDVDFSNSSCDGSLAFTGTTFGSGANFDGVAYNSVVFLGSIFASVEFNYSIINNANFGSSRFTETLTFINASFGAAYFSDCHFGEFASFFQCEFSQYANFGHTQPNNINHPSSTSLPNFNRCTFKSTLDLSGRDLQSDFTDCEYFAAPKLLNCTNQSVANFHNVKLKITSGFRAFRGISEKELINIRLFRKVAEETKNHDLERDLYIEERLAEQGISIISNLSLLDKVNVSKVDKWKSIVFDLPKALAMVGMSFFYNVLSDFGRSIFRPILWFFFSFWAFSFHNNIHVFRQIWQNRPKTFDMGSSSHAVTPEIYNQIADSANFANHLPIVGQLALDSDMKRVLFCGYVAEKSTLCLPPNGYDFYLVVQNIFVGLLIFLFGLAIRNYFKIK